MITIPSWSTYLVWMEPSARKSPLKAHATAARATAVLAAGLGLGSAAISAYWAAGGTGLLDSIGGEIERWGRQRSASVVLALWLIVVLKCGIALAAPVIVVRSRWLPPWTAGRIPRALSWIAATVLAAYGAVLTVGGLLVQSGLIGASPDGDRRALAWHAYLWDPWFLAWGLAFMACLWLRRADGTRTN
jgi:hypothetical protein